MINFTNNKKLNIKINILLAAFLEDEFYNIEVCLDEINKSLQENIGIWTYVHKTDDVNGNGSRDVIGGETPHITLSLALSNLLAKHHAVHHAQHFSY